MLRSLLVFGAKDNVSTVNRNNDHFKPKARACFKNLPSENGLQIRAIELAEDLLAQMGGDCAGFSLQYAFNCVFKGVNHARLKVIQQRHMVALVLARSVINLGKSSIVSLNNQSNRGFFRFKAWIDRESQSDTVKIFSVDFLEKEIEFVLSSSKKK